MVSEGTITDENAIHEIRAVFAQRDWRYPLRRIIARIRDDSWRAGYNAGLYDAYAQVKDEAADG